jgi:hypothetical protein
MVVDKLKRFPLVDFNQGLESGRFTPEFADLLGSLKCKVRFAFDHVNFESKVKAAIDLCRERTTKKIGIYVLIGFNDTPEDALYRLELVRSWGIDSSPMRFQPLDAKAKNEFVGSAWTDHELTRMATYYSNLQYFRSVPYEDFECRKEEIQGQLF